MIRITFGNSHTGEIDYQYAKSVQITYSTLRNDEDRQIAHINRETDEWTLESDGTTWTDVNLDCTPAELLDEA